MYIGRMHWSKKPLTQFEEREIHARLAIGGLLILLVFLVICFFLREVIYSFF